MKKTNNMTIEISPASGSTSKGSPIVGKATLPPGIKGCYVAAGEIFFYGPKQSPKGDVQSMDVQAIVQAVLAAIGK